MTKESPVLQVLCREDGVQVGSLEGEEGFGVYLSGDYLADLNQVVQAVERRIEQAPQGGVPEPLRNLIGMLDRLLTTHASVSYLRLMDAALPAGVEAQDGYSPSENRHQGARDTV